MFLFAKHNENKTVPETKSIAVFTGIAETTYLTPFNTFHSAVTH